MKKWNFGLVPLLHKPFNYNNYNYNNNYYYCICFILTERSEELLFSLFLSAIIICRGKLRKSHLKLTFCLQTKMGIPYSHLSLCYTQWCNTFIIFYTIIIIDAVQTSIIMSTQFFIRTLWEWYCLGGGGGFMRWWSCPSSEGMTACTWTKLKQSLLPAPHSMWIFLKFHTLTKPFIKFNI